MSYGHRHFRGWSAFKTRRNPPAAWDFQKGDLTDDVLWNDLDLSSIVPEAATAVFFKCNVKDDLVGSQIYFSNIKDYNTYYSCDARTLIANVESNYFCFAPIENNSQKIKMQCTVQPSNWTKINIYIIGWWVS